MVIFISFHPCYSFLADIRCLHSCMMGWGSTAREYMHGSPCLVPEWSGRTMPVPMGQWSGNELPLSVVLGLLVFFGLRGLQMRWRWRFPCISSCQWSWQWHNQRSLRVQHGVGGRFLLTSWNPTRPSIDHKAKNSLIDVLHFYEKRRVMVGDLQTHFSNKGSMSGT